MDHLKVIHDYLIALDNALLTLPHSALKEARRESGLTCREVADRIGYSDAYVSMVENRKCKVTSDYVCAFYRALLSSRELQPSGQT